MKFRITAFAAALLCCCACVETDYEIGGSLFAVDDMYDVFVDNAPISEIHIDKADGLSGFSNTRITFGAIRDKDYGLTTRSAALPLIPLYQDGHVDFGKNPVCKNFYITLLRDTCSTTKDGQEAIFQNLNIYELEEAFEYDKTYDCNTVIPHKDVKITKGSPIYNGSDTLLFRLSDEYGQKILDLPKSAYLDAEEFRAAIPGIFIETNLPSGSSEGGRINMFNLQTKYNLDYNYLENNYGVLVYEAEFNGVRKDTLSYFLLGGYDFYQIDSLFQNNTKYPQICLNMTTQESDRYEGMASAEIHIEGGGGLKPRIPAYELKRIAEEIIIKAGGDPKKAIINKATLEMPFTFPENYEDIDRFWPKVLSPTCRLDYDGTTSFGSISDTSSSTENQGDINRTQDKYSPDISYHLQQILLIDENDAANSKTQYYKKGMYDIWLLILADEVSYTTVAGNKEMSDYYNYLAYQSYYNGMYNGGYGGYGGYGYGGYGGYGYNNYYSYAMLASSAAQSQTQKSVTRQLDKDRFYKAALNGPDAEGAVPTLKLTFSLPKKTE